MHAPSLFLLLGAAAAVAILHSILPDHWIPLAVVARTRHWSILRVTRVSALASIGHVVTSLILGGIVALIGLQFQSVLDTQQGHIIGGILILTGLGFLIWGLVGGGHGHSHGEGDHSHDHDNTHNSHDDDHDHDHSSAETPTPDTHHDHEHHDHDEQPAHEHGGVTVATAPSKTLKQQTLASKLSAIAVPFGVAASPDLTILPVALAASALGGGAIVGVLSVFAVLTIGTFVGLTVLATLAGYQIKGAWIENNANTITSIVLIAIGVVAFIGF